jgi:hypothetical protein
MPMTVENTLRVPSDAGCARGCGKCPRYYRGLGPSHDRKAPQVHLGGQVRVDGCRVGRATHLRQRGHEVVQELPLDGPGDSV